MALTIKQALQQGVAAHNAGNWQEAKQAYQTILQCHPKHPDANHNLGLIAISMNQIEAAILLFKTALDVNPNVEQFWISYIDALVKNNQVKGAKQAIKKAKKNGFDTKKLKALLSQSTDVTHNKVPPPELLNSLLGLYQNGRFSDAKKLSVEITKDFPKHQFAWKVLGAVLGATGKKSEAVNANQIAVALSPQDAEAHSNLGNTLEELGRLDDAKASYKKAIALKPDYAEAHYNLGITLKELGRLDDAKASYEQALALNPGFVKAHSNLGITLHELGRLDKAEKSCRQAIALQPDFAEAYYNLGITLQEIGRLDEAEASYAQAVALNPDFTLAHSNLGNTLQGLGRLTEAEASYTKAIALNPAYAEAHSNLGNTLQELGRLNDAEKSCRQAIALNPDFAEAHSNLGITLKELGRLGEAEKSCRQAIALNPDFAEAHSNLGITLHELGRLDEAEASYNQAIALKPGFAEAHSNLGNTLKELGRLDESEASYTKAIALNPDFAQAQNNLVELLTSYISQRKSSQPIVKVDQEIKEINLNETTSGVISNDKIIHLFYKSSEIIKKYDLDLGTELSQAFRRNSVDLNCNRHKKIFDKFNVIPKFCFGCYKVQVEPRSVLELIKLFVVFDQIKLSENNIRKCMIEMRSEISGFYKGLIYCSSLKEAYQIADYLEMVINERIGSGLPLAVKRGCSEFPIMFPDYKEINKFGAQLMNYNEDWKQIEENYDLQNPIKSKSIIPPSLSCLSLSDVLIVRNWIDYAKGIGDSSAQLLNQNGVVSHRVYEIAKSRLETHVWREMI